MNDREAADSVADFEVEPFVDDRAQKRRIIYFSLLYSAIFGVIICFLPEEDSVLDFLLSLPLLICGIWWCFTDAAERDRRIGVVTRLLLIFVFVAGFPIYLFQTRGAGAVKSLALLIAFIAAMFACMVASAIATFYLGEITGLWNVEFQ